MSRVNHYIIGDVHGMFQELERLIDVLKPSSEDTVVFVGDLVDKGPSSGDVVRFVRELSSRTNVVVVEGNHEEKHRRFRKHRRNQSGIETRMSGHQRISVIFDNMSEDDRSFMDTFVPFHRIHEHDILVVHGGIPGDMVEFPKTVEETKSWSSKKRRSINKIQRVRRVDKDTGKFVQNGDQTPDDPMWSEVYDGRFGHVVFGHMSFLDGPRMFPHSTGIDTGVVYGGPLTSMVVSENGDISFVQVENETGVHSVRRKD